MQVYFEVKTVFEDLGSISLAKIKRGPVVLIKKGLGMYYLKRGPYVNSKKHWCQVCKDAILFQSALFGGMKETDSCCAQTSLTVSENSENIKCCTNIIQGQGTLFT